jgi:hypothetical protein
MFSQQKYLKYDLKNTISIPSLNKDFQSLYLKYKNKYLGLKNQFGGSIGTIKYGDKQQEFPLDFINRTINDLKLSLNIDTKAQLVCPEGKIELTDDCILTGYHAKENIEFVNESAKDVAPTNDEEFEAKIVQTIKYWEYLDDLYDKIDKNKSDIKRNVTEKTQQIIDDYKIVKKEEFDRTYPEITIIQLDESKESITINLQKNNQFIIEDCANGPTGAKWELEVSSGLQEIENIATPEQKVMKIVYKDSELPPGSYYCRYILFKAPTSGNYSIIARHSYQTTNSTMNINIIVT